MINVILYGAGSDFSKILPLLTQGGYNPLCVADSNETKAGGYIENIPIVTPDKIVDYGAKTIIITASFFDSIYERIKLILADIIEQYTVLVSPYAWLMLVNVQYNDNLLIDASNFIKARKSDIFSIYDLNDSKTKHILDFIISARIDQKYTFYNYETIKGMQYVEGYFYENELKDYEKVTFIDVGAYIGDTYELVTEMYDNIECYYAYEPSKDNFEILNKNLGVSRGDCRICCKNSALGNKNGFIEMGKSGGEFGIVDDEKQESEKVLISKLDDEELLIEGKLVLKMDVEGAELDVLKGAIETIRKYKPVMAICVYHRYVDIYDLPKFLMDNGLKYRFVLKSGIHTHLLAFPE